MLVGVTVQVRPHAQELVFRNVKNTLTIWEHKRKYLKHRHTEGKEGLVNRAVILCLS
jgi:hypothetical protein